MDGVTEDRESRKCDVQTTMDFAANIEKVKEVTEQISILQGLFTEIIDQFNFFYCFLVLPNSMVGTGVLYQAKQQRKSYRMNLMAAL